MDSGDIAWMLMSTALVAITPASGFVTVGGALLIGLVAVGYAVVGTFAIIKFVDLLLGIRVKPEVEEMGLDLSVHGEVAYQA